MEAKQRCTQIEEELELAHNVAQKLEAKLEEVQIRTIVLREEREKVVSFLQQELNRTHTSAEFYKHQVWNFSFIILIKGILECILFDM